MGDSVAMVETEIVCSSLSYLRGSDIHFTSAGIAEIQDLGPLQYDGSKSRELLEM